jgi:hypothetical protein
LPELVGKRVTLSYIPATAADQQLVSNYGGLYNVPSYLLQVRPQLKVEGIVKAEGTAENMGVDQHFKMIFSLPDQGSDQVANEISAGGYYAIGLVPNRLQSVYSAVLQERAQQLLDFVQAGGDRTSDNGLGEQLYLSVMTYFWEVDRQTDSLAAQGNVVYAKLPGEGIFGLDLEIRTLFDTPVSAQVNGVYIDVDRAVYLPGSKSADSQITFAFMTASGRSASAMEHGIIEQFYGVSGISSVKAIQLANAQGLRTYTITSANLANVIPVLQVPNEVKVDIQNAVNAGKEVIVPEQELQVSDWHGVGYVIADPTTGAAAYLISGGLAGASAVVKKSLEILKNLLSKSKQIIDCILDDTVTIIAVSATLVFFLFGVGLGVLERPLDAIVVLLAAALLSALAVNLIRERCPEIFARRLLWPIEKSGVLKQLA